MDGSYTFLRCIAMYVPVVLLALSGWFLGYKSWFNMDANESLMRVTVNFMFPLYVIFSLPKIYSEHGFWELWGLIISPIVVILFLLLIGLACVFLVGVPRSYKFSVLCIYFLPSMGTYSIILAKNSCANYGPLHNNDNCDYIVSYFCMMWLPYIIIANILTCSLLKKDTGDERKTFDLIIKYSILPLPVSCVIANIIGVIPSINYFLYVYRLVFDIFT